MTNFRFILVGLLLFVASVSVSVAQNGVTVFGIISEAGGTDVPLEFAVVQVVETKKTVETNAAGEYSITLPANRSVSLRLVRVGYKEATIPVSAMTAGTKMRLDIQLANNASTQEVVINGIRTAHDGMVRENVQQLKMLPTTTGNLESILPHIALGASSGTGGELSSQYNVRGGNYDENLVYVNDFEIYRPQLVRAGQQEGLTFANMDLVRDLSFSSGGFASRYGDKLSSVLDVKYKRPDSLRSSVSMSALGASAHIEGSVSLDTNGYRKFRYLAGARYKTTRYLLGSLDIKGEYLPNFADIQAYLTYDLSRSWQLGVIGNYNRSDFLFRPTTRSTATGLIDFALQLYTVYEGQEWDQFTTGMGGVSLTYLPDRKRNPFFLKLMASSFLAQEYERFDILGYYLLGQIDVNLGNDDAGEITNVLGTGTQHQWVRNYLQSQVTNTEVRGGYEYQKPVTNPNLTISHFVQFGVKAQFEDILDKINEWERLDSAGYSLKFDTSALFVNSVLKTQNTLTSQRFSAFLEDTYTWRRTGFAELKATLGVRASYWTLNKEPFVTPRAQFLFKPLNWQKDVSFRLATGLYYQPAFYRELRNIYGVVNPNVLAQKSAHIVGGLTYDFYAGARRRIPFRFIAEAYYKQLWDLVSYDVENVRVRYAGQNNATGYVTGLDLRINGEFVPNAESWLNIGFLHAREAIDSVQHLKREIGDTEAQPVKDVPRPTDQLMTFSMFFQDYMPKHPQFSTQLNLTVGTGLPFGIPNNNVVYRNTYRFKAYHRVDIGFSWRMYDPATSKPNNFLRFTRGTYLSLEVFNLLKVANVASNTWIKTVYAQQYAVPNYLTSRRINLKLRMDF